MTQSIFAAQPYNLKLNHTVVFRCRNPLTVKNRNSLIRSLEKTLPSYKISKKIQGVPGLYPIPARILPFFKHEKSRSGLQNIKPQSAMPIIKKNSNQNKLKLLNSNRGFE
jgi:hypothetical protein